MFEYSSVSASSYDPGALVAKLNESAAEGWDVVAIVPTGGDVSAFMRRQVEAAAPSTDGPVSGEPSAVAEGEPWAATATVAESTEPATEEWPAETGGEPFDVGVETPAADTEPAEAEPAAVEEPPGWAAAPTETPTEAAVSSAPEEVGSAASEAPTAVGEAEPTAVEPTPVVEPVPEPPTTPPEPAPVVTTPAGWYPDPSGRYELRYWDGTQWTEHVARQGQQFTDPPVR